MFVVNIARRILERAVPACIDVAKCFPVQSDQRITFKQKMEMRFESSLGKTIFFDSRCLSPYEDIGADVAKRHKRLLIQLPNGDLQEITELPDSIFENLNLETPLERYYFLDKKEHEEAEKLVRQLA